MGELYLASLEGAAGFEKAVAIKRLLPHLSDDAEFLTRFVDEAKIASTLTHGNIVPVFDMGKVEGQYFLAMDYIDGVDLRSLLADCRANDQRMPTGFALFIASEVCKGLAYAHSRSDGDGEALQIVHRDVSPSNILLSRSGEVKIVDFGIASARSRLSRTVTGELKGKLAYMSPEQARGTRVDARSDLFSLGAVLYEMLAGARPFEGDSDMEILGRVQRGEHTHISKQAPHLDKEVCGIVEKALAVAPDKRYASAEEMHVALVHALFRDTGPVTHQQLAGFVERHARASILSKISNASPGLDTLLNQELDRAGAPRTPSSGVPRMPRHDHTATQTAPPPEPQAATGDVTQPGPIIERVVERDRSRTGLLLTILLLLTGVGLAFAAGLLPPSPGVPLEVTSNPEGAQVFIDGNAAGITRLRTHVEPGEHTVRVQFEGYQPETTTVVLERGTPGAVEVDLDPAPVSIRFETNAPEARISVNGDGPYSQRMPHIVPVGEEVVVAATADGFEPFEARMTFEVGQLAQVLELTPRPQSELRDADATTAGSDAAEPGDNTAPSDSSRASTNGSATDARVEPTPRRSRRTFRLDGLPAGATITVNGEEVRESFSLDVDSGEADLLITAPGYAPYRQQLDPESSRDRIDVTMQEAGDPGMLVVRITDEPMLGDIYIDGELAGPYNVGWQTTLPAGEHVVEVRYDAMGLTSRHPVTIVSGQQEQVLVIW